MIVAEDICFVLDMGADNASVSLFKGDQPLDIRLADGLSDEGFAASILKDNAAIRLNRLFDGMFQVAGEDVGFRMVDV